MISRVSSRSPDHFLGRDQDLRVRALLRSQEILDWHALLHTWSAYIARQASRKAVGDHWGGPMKGPPAWALGRDAQWMGVMGAPLREGHLFPHMETGAKCALVYSITMDVKWMDPPSLIVDSKFSWNSKAFGNSRGGLSLKWGERARERGKFWTFPLLEGLRLFKSWWWALALACLFLWDFLFGCVALWASAHCEDEGRAHGTQGFIPNLCSQVKLHKDSALDWIEAQQHASATWGICAWVACRVGTGRHIASFSLTHDDPDGMAGSTWVNLSRHTVRP